MQLGLMCGYDFSYYFENDMLPSGDPMWKTCDIDGDYSALKGFVSRFYSMEEILLFCDSMRHHKGVAVCFETILSQLMRREARGLSTNVYISFYGYF